MFQLFQRPTCPLLRDSSDCIGDAIKKLLTDKTKYIQMAEKALHCAKKFNADDMIERVEKILAD